jgi:hypothetical protein
MARIARSAEIGVNFYQSFDYIRKFTPKVNGLAAARLAHPSSRCKRLLSAHLPHLNHPNHHHNHPKHHPNNPQRPPQPVSAIEAICSSLAKNAVDIRPGMIVVFSEGGKVARLVAKYRCAVRAARARVHELGVAHGVSAPASSRPARRGCVVPAPRAGASSPPRRVSASPSSTCATPAWPASP